MSVFSQKNLLINQFPISDLNFVSENRLLFKFMRTVEKAPSRERLNYQEDPQLIEYLRQNGIDASNFSETFQLDLFLIDQIGKEKALSGQSLSNHIENLKNGASLATTKEEIDRNSSYSEKERWLMYIYFRQGAKKKLDNLNFILYRENLTEDKEQELRRNLDGLNKKITDTLQKNPAAQPHYAELIIIEKELQEDLLKLQQHPAFESSKPKLSLVERKNKSREKIRLLQMIGAACPNNPEILSEIAEKFDLELAVDRNLNITDKDMRSNLEKEAERLNQICTTVMTKERDLKSTARIAVSLEQRLDTAPGETVSDTLISMKKKAGDLLTDINKNFIHNERVPPWLKLGVAILGGFFGIKAIGGLWEGKSKFWLGAKIIGIGYILAQGFSYSMWRVPIGKKLLMTDTKYGEGTSRDNLRGIFKEQAKGKPVKKFERMADNFYQFYMYADTLKPPSSVLNKYQKSAETIDLPVPDQKIAQDGLNLFFERYDPNFIKHNFAKELADPNMSFATLALIIFKNDHRLEHELEKEDGLFDTAAKAGRWLVDGIRYPIFYAGLAPFGISVVDSTETDRRQSQLTTMQVVGGKEGLFEKTKRTAHGAAYEGKNLLNWMNKSAWTGSFLIPDNWFEEHDRNKEIVKQIQIKTIDEEQKFDSIAGANVNIASGSIEFVEQSLTYEPYQRMFIEPPGRTSSLKQLREFYVETSAGETKAAYLTAKVDLPTDRFEWSNETTMVHALNQAYDKSKQLAKTNGITDEQFAQKQLIDAVIFSEQTDASGNRITEPQIRVFVRIPLGSEYVRLKTSPDAARKPGSAFEAGKHQKKELLRPAEPLTLNRDFDDTIDRLHLIKIFPVKLDYDYLNDILLYLSQEYTQHSVPELTRAQAKEKVLNISTIEFAEMIRKTEFEMRKTKGHSYKIAYLYHPDDLLPLTEYEQKLDQKEKWVIDDKIDDPMFGASNPQVVEEKFRATVVRKYRALYQIALMSLINPTLIQNSNPLTDPIFKLIPDQIERDKVIAEVTNIIKGKKLITKSEYQRAASQIVELYETTLKKKADQMVP